MNSLTKHLIAAKSALLLAAAEENQTVPCYTEKETGIIIRDILQILDLLLRSRSQPGRD